MNYGYKRNVPFPFGEAVERVRAELLKEGFGVLTEIDVKASLKEKLGLDYGNYTILGACNPRFALRALQAQKDIGLLMPCNVIVYEENDEVFVSAILPTVAMGMVGNPVLAEIALTGEEKLRKVVDNV